MNSPSSIIFDSPCDTVSSPPGAVIFHSPGDTTFDSSGDKITGSPCDIEVHLQGRGQLLKGPRFVKEQPVSHLRLALHMVLQQDKATCLFFPRSEPRNTLEIQM